MAAETTYFRFQGKIYEQTFGMSIGSSLSSGLSNLFMEFFEDKALKEASRPLKYWGGMWMIWGVVTKKISEEELFNHTNKETSQHQIHH